MSGVEIRPERADGPVGRALLVARGLLTAVEDAARVTGYWVLRLDTSAGQPEARALYESSGYRAIEPYNDNQYAAHRFQKELR